MSEIITVAPVDPARNAARFGSGRRMRPSGVGILSAIGQDVSRVDARDVDGFLQAARLDWEVQPRRVYTASPSGVLTEDEGARALVRADTGAVFGYVSDGFRPVQNREIATLFASAFEAMGLQWQRAGSIRGGAVIFALAKVATLNVSGDLNELWIMLSNGHDGTAALRVAVSFQRIVCANQLPGLEKSGQATRLRHTIDGVRDLNRLVEATRRSIETGRRQAESFEVLASTRGDINAILDRVYPLGENPSRGDDGRMRARETIRSLYRQGKGNRGETMWDAVNGVTEWEDHHAPRRSDESGLWGAGAQRKALAFETALSLCNAGNIIEGVLVDE